MRGSLVVVAMIAIGCSSPERTSTAAMPAQAAYVWQRNWTPAVREAVAHPPAALDGLHVLAAEADAGQSDLVMMALDETALAAARRPITLVVRINGAHPVEALSLAPIVRVGEGLRRAGVDVIGIEVDHDCATARLGEYARWLRVQRPAGWQFSITALPTWAGSRSLVEVAAAVDDIVVQVHAVRAPAIFDANQAWRDLTRFARAVHGTPMRVALPTYSAVVREVEVSVDPDVVAAFVRRLAAKPIAGVGGVVWFRLPVADDEHTWSQATFARIVATTSSTRGGSSVTRTARISLVAQGTDRFDVVVTNPGEELVDLPPVHVEGAIAAADMVAGYREHGPGRWDAPRRSLARKESIVIGWIHGKDLALVD